jgi:uncharacterized repeat protein (TIGR02543 family)
MGKRLIIQRRGRGTPTYRSSSHRFRGKVSYRSYDAYEKDGSIKGLVTDIIHDPGRSAPVAVVKFENGEEKLVLAPESIAIDDEIEYGVSAPVQPGNTLPLSEIPEGTPVYNIENNPGDGGKFVRSSGTYASLITHDVGKAMIELPSGELKATLIPNKYTITFNLNAGEDVVTGMDSYLNEDGSYSMEHTWSYATAVNAEPERTNYIFLGWEADVEDSYDGSKIGAEVGQNVTLTAKWEKITYTITTVASPSEGGTTTGDGTYDVESEATVKATANANYQFVGWYENDSKVSDDAEYIFTVTGNRALTAKFEKDIPAITTYTVTTKTQGNGSATGGGTFEVGTEIKLSAVADEGNVFIGWRGENGELITIDKEFKHTVKEDVTFTAYFEKASDYKNDYAYIFGYNDTEMGAEGYLLRSEVSVMVHRLVKQNGMLGNFRYDSENPSFADIQGEWFQSGIEFMHYKGAFNVEEGGNVQPYVAVTRGETFKIVALGLGLTSDTTLSYAAYANLLYELGYIVGDGSGNLDVESTITRAEFCTMYNRIIGRENALLVDNNGKDITAETYGFKDLDSDEWYYEAMLRATSAYSDEGYVDIAKRGIRNNLDDYGN